MITGTSKADRGACSDGCTALPRLRPKPTQSMSCRTCRILIWRGVMSPKAGNTGTCQGSRTHVGTGDETIRNPHLMMTRQTKKNNDLQKNVRYTLQTRQLHGEKGLGLGLGKIKNKNQRLGA